MKPRRQTSLPGRPPRKRIVVTLPAWLVRAIDAEAKRIGVARGTLLEYWLIEQCKARLRSPGRR